MGTTPDVKVMRLRYAGTCGCGRQVDAGERAAYVRSSRSVRCLPCHTASEDEAPTPTAAESVAQPTAPPSHAVPTEPETEPAPGLDPVPRVLDVGVAGAGAKREYERRKAKDDAARAERSRVWRALNAFFYPDGRQTTHAWRVGAAGEERVAQALTVLVDEGHGYALHDRRIPGRRANIDHLFVGAGGVFVIDAKQYKNAEVTVERQGGLFSPATETVKVGGRRRTNLVDGIHEQCEVVRSVLAKAGHEDVVIVPVLCFVDAYLPFWEGHRRVGDVRLSGPKKLGKVVAAAGEVDDERRFELAMALSEALPSMT